MNLQERKLTPSELKKRDDIIKNMLLNKRDLVSKYGAEAEKVVFGRATNMAIKSALDGADPIDESINNAYKHVNNAQICENMNMTSGLTITPKGKTTLEDLMKVLDDEGLYYEEDYRENTLLMPEELDQYDDLEKFLDEILASKNFDYTVEGIFESQNSPHMRDIEVEGDEYEEIQKLLRDLNIEDDL